MKINLRLSESAMTEDQFEAELVKIGFKKSEDSEHKDSGAQKLYFKGPNGSEVFAMHNKENDFVRVAYKPGADKDTKHLQGSIDDGDFEEFLGEIKTAMGKGK